MRCTQNISVCREPSCTSQVVFTYCIQVRYDSVTVSNTRTLKLKPLNGIQQYLQLSFASCDMSKLICGKLPLFLTHIERATSFGERRTLLFIARLYKCVLGMVHSVIKTKHNKEIKKIKIFLSRKPKKNCICAVVLHTRYKYHYMNTVTITYSQYSMGISMT